MKRAELTLHTAWSTSYWSLFVLYFIFIICISRTLPPFNYLESYIYYITCLLLYLNNLVYTFPSIIRYSIVTYWSFVDYPYRACIRILKSLIHKYRSCEKPVFQLNCINRQCLDYFLNVSNGRRKQIIST